MLNHQTPIIFSFNKENKLAQNITKKLDLEEGDWVYHLFPDQESYLRILTDVKDRDVFIFESLDRPNDKLLSLLFFAKAVKDLGARRVGLVAPYLCYLRQDAQFKIGEAVTSRYFAHIVSEYFDWLVTMDPHLHRYKNLNEIYTIPTLVLKSNQAISDWINANVKNPIIIGPDEESKQWAESIAGFTQSSCVLLEKIRKSDTEVSISLPKTVQFESYTPVLVDDIISTGHTMLKALEGLKALGVKNKVCVGIHAIFAGDAAEQLSKQGAVLVTCNTILHPSNGIDVSNIFADNLRRFFANLEIT